MLFNYCKLTDIYAMLHYITTINNIYVQMKRKRPSQPNGTASPAGELEKEEDHHTGPELQRTGRWV